MMGISLFLLVFLLMPLIFKIRQKRRKINSFKASKKEAERQAFYQQSEQWFIRQLKNPQKTIDGQTFNPKFQYMFEQIGDTAEQSFQLMKRLFSFSLGRKLVRYKIDREWTLYTKTTPPMHEVFDLKIKGRGGHRIPIRIYIPELADTKEKWPVLVYAHGGGYLFGSIKALDRAVRLIANEAKMMVVSVNYRLAPENPYPAQSDDGEDVFLWAQKHIEQFHGNAQYIAVGGDSGGGHISINIAQRQLAKGQKPPVALLLYYPATGIPFNDVSNQLFGKGFGLDSSFFEYILTQVFPNENWQTTQPDVYMAPVQSKNLRKMPPTIIATAGFDILRDSGKRFAGQLRADGVDVLYLNYPSLPHSFLQFSGIIEDAEKAATETARLLGQKIREKMNQYHDDDFWQNLVEQYLAQNDTLHHNQ